MSENLVIVESPAKAKTIEKFLGKNFLVMSSFGHVRDLSKKNYGIDIKKNYEPVYEISEDKKKIVGELKKFVKKAKFVWLASDEDREGEAIAWHLAEVLQLDVAKTKRIVFHEITKDAILNAVENPRTIDYDLVNAQQARRVLDRLVGFELSPVLWKKVKPSLSAGRVQSVAVRLIVDREREIEAFASHSYYRVIATFISANEKGVEFKAELSKNFEQKSEAVDFLNVCKNTKFVVEDIVTKPAKKSPPPPFITSTLQQEASRRLGFSVSQTMSIAQKLYESGQITYMRTDSVNLSETAISAAGKEIATEYGDKYVQTRRYKTKAKGAQEAHEAIRPTFMNNHNGTGSRSEKKLYELIWKRSIASQMSDALLEKTTATISIEGRKESFIASGEVMKFDGFLKVYTTVDDEINGEPAKGLLPEIELKQSLKFSNISATQKFTHYPARFTEASLVRKLEELGIGRPSTYAPIISTIQNRGYVVKEDRIGLPRDYNSLILEGTQLQDEMKSEMSGTEKSKMFPTDIGCVVNDFLVENFKDILDFHFTASVEKQFDEIASGKLNWSKMIDMFYKPFHKGVEDTVQKSGKNQGQKILGTDPASGLVVAVKIGRYGPMVQIGEAGLDEKPRFAALRKDQQMDKITLEDALELFKLPRELGEFENKKIVAAVGRFGPYLRHDVKFYSIPKTEDPFSILLPKAIELIEEKREADSKKQIKSFVENENMLLLNGRWGAYLACNKKNYRLPKTVNPEELEYADCLKIIQQSEKTESKPKKKK